MFKVNEYFDGTVKSIAFDMTAGPATIGVMAAGEYEFGTSQLEIMHVVAGALTVKALSSDVPNTGRDYKIDALAFGVALSGAGSSGGTALTGSLAGAGAGVGNKIDSTTHAYITQTTNADSAVVDVQSGGALLVEATDNSKIRADSGGYAIAIAATTTITVQ